MEMRSSGPVLLYAVCHKEAEQDRFQGNPGTLYTYVNGRKPVLYAKLIRLFIETLS